MTSLAQLNTVVSSPHVHRQQAALQQKVLHQAMPTKRKATAEPKTTAAVKAKVAKAVPAKASSAVLTIEACKT